MEEEGETVHRQLCAHVSEQHWLSSCGRGALCPHRAPLCTENSAPGRAWGLLSRGLGVRALPGEARLCVCFSNSPALLCLLCDSPAPAFLSVSQRPAHQFLCCRGNSERTSAPLPGDTLCACAELPASPSGGSIPEARPRIGPWSWRPGQCPRSLLRVGVCSHSTACRF